MAGLKEENSEQEELNIYMESLKLGQKYTLLSIRRRQLAWLLRDAVDATAEETEARNKKIIGWEAGTRRLVQLIIQEETAKSD